MAIDKHGPGALAVADEGAHTDQQGERDIPLNMIVGGLGMHLKERIMLFLNCRDGHTDGVRTHIADHGSTYLNCRDSCGMTPLMWSAHGGHAEIVECLLNHGANPHAVDEMRQDRAVTALDYAQGCGLPAAEGDSEDEDGEDGEHGPTGQHEQTAALLKSFMGRNAQV